MTVEKKTPEVPYANWRQMVAKYQQPDVRKAVWQIINSFGGLLLLWALMYWSLSVGYWLTLLLAFPAAGFAIRIFIIQHDCGHGSFFKAKQNNHTIGTVCSLFTFTPYLYWRKSHAIHHAHHAELEERGIGDIWTLTVDEYRNASRMKRLVYRVFRNPFFLFVIAPAVNFIILQRFVLPGQDKWKRHERASVLWTNIALLALYGTLSWLIGWQAVLLIQLPITIISSSAGTFMFYVQHQFERTYWEHTPEWDYTLAAMHGSSYYQLPRILQWFTGNIGFHHIHHLSPRIPNYRLQACHDENPTLQEVMHLTIGKSLQTMSLVLWEEKQRRLISFAEARR
ncbi:MAG: fatty acid desaturase [Caldilineaceae bacterium]|nr:fatty acid desaturase [Caldilineaceae bacterium]